MKRYFLISLVLGLFPLFSQAAELIHSRPITEVTATQHYQYGIRVATPIYGKVELSLLQAPKGMRLSQSNQLLWQTDYDDAGQHKIIVEAREGDEVQQQEFILTVNKKNRPPIIRSQAKKQINEGEKFFYRVDAVDPDGDPISIHFNRVPKGAETNENSISWQTDYESAGEYPIHIAVTDGEAVVEQKFFLTVNNVNRPPVFVEPEAFLLQLREGELWRLTLSVSDPDGDDVKLSLPNPPEGMRLDGQLLSWRPNYRQSGEYYVDVVADDGQDETTLVLHLQVENVNRLPEITSTAITTVNEGEEYVYAVRAYDPDETPLSYRLLKGPEGMEMQGHYLQWQPDYGSAGQYEVVIAVADDEDEVRQTFNLEVKHTNRAPVIHSIPTTTIKEAETFTYVFEVSDPDGDELTIEYDIPEQVSREGNKMHWQTDYKSAGKYPFVIRVADKETTVEQKFTLVVENVNHKPVFTSEPITVGHEAVYYEYQLTAEDEDGEELEFALERSPRGMHIKDGLIMWIPNFDQAGQHEVVATVTDGIDTVKQRFTIDIENTNREPTIEDIPDQSLIVGQRLRYPLRVDDIDGDEVTTRLVHAPKGMSINRRNELVWKTTARDIGTVDVIVEASDGDLAVRTHFQVEVLAKD